MKERRIRFIFDGEIEEREKRGLSGLDRVRTEHIDELWNRRREVSAIAVGSFAEASDLFGSFNFGREIVGLKETESFVDGVRSSGTIVIGTCAGGESIRVGGVFW